MNMQILYLSMILTVSYTAFLPGLAVRTVFADGPHPSIAVPDGYATLNGGTTGGGDATPVVITTEVEFRELVAGDTPRVIVVQGKIDLGGSVSVGSNKTIVGADTSSGLYGGTVNVRGHNCIFQNLALGPTEGDVMEISGGTNVFVHRCEFVDSTDESLSIVRGADFVTVSWCKFYFTQPHSHAFGHLVGNRTDRVSDRGKLNTTMHHNWYGANMRGRMPRVRYGHVHIYNNLFNSPGNNQVIGVGHESEIRLENSHFEDVRRPWNPMDASPGEIGWAGLKFVRSSEPDSFPNANSTIFTPPYEYTLDPVEDVKAIVTAGAGNVDAP
jgi:pectate lyase